MTFLGAIRSFFVTLPVIGGSRMAVFKAPSSSLPLWSEGLHGCSTSFDGFAFSTTGIGAFEKVNGKRLIRDL